MKYKSETLGVMIDVSRNAVMTVPTLKSYLLLLRRMGYNMAMLYSEDAYEITGEPYFGYLRGKYTKAQLKELDAYAYSIGIELIPCIQTLGHLWALPRWKVYPMDHGDVLLCDDERTYDLIDKMLATVSECFRTRRVHIGMDEAYYVGKGKHLERFGYEPPLSIMRRHLDRVCKIAAKYGYEKPMIWSDMLFNPLNNNGYRAPKTELSQEIKDTVPKNVIPVYWEYDLPQKELYDGMLYNHSQITDELWFAGSVITCCGYVPELKTSMRNTLSGIDACKDANCKNIIITMWGDDGGECSMFTALPALCYYAMYAEGITDEAKIKAKFKRITGMEYDDFIDIDIPNEIDDKASHENPSKYMMFNDLLCGSYDYSVDASKAQAYASHARRLEGIAKKSRKYGYLFNTAAKLCGFLEVKYPMGVKIREAYKNGDKAALRRIAEEDIPTAEKRLTEFYNTYRRQWTRENMFYGFEVQDIRLGGLKQRLASCRSRLLEYIDGKTDKIDELEQEILPINGVVGIGDKKVVKGVTVLGGKYQTIVTPSPYL